MAEPPTAESGERAQPETIALAALWAFTALAVAGYATFGRHPERLGHSTSAVAVYSVAFTFFARAHVLLAGAALAVVLIRRAGAKWLVAFAALYAISLGSELAGTTLGLPFGPYRYTDGLGPKWFGHVPVLIPLSWFFMSAPSYLLARRRTHRPVVAVLLGSFTLLAWDLALDPAMSWATKYWVWGSEGPYYGMPLLNLAGWYLTGVALMTALALLRFDTLAANVPTGWLAGFYLANLALPLGLVAAHGVWGAVVLSVAAVGFSIGVPALRAPRDRAATIGLRVRTMRKPI